MGQSIITGHPPPPVVRSKWHSSLSLLPIQTSKWCSPLSLPSYPGARWNSPLSLPPHSETQMVQSIITAPTYPQSIITVPTLQRPKWDSPLSPPPHPETQMVQSIITAPSFTPKRLINSPQQSHSGIAPRNKPFCLLPPPPVPMEHSHCPACPIPDRSDDATPARLQSGGRAHPGNARQPLVLSLLPERDQQAPLANEEATRGVGSGWGRAATVAAILCRPR